MIILALSPVNQTDAVNWLLAEEAKQASPNPSKQVRLPLFAYNNFPRAN